MSFDLVCFFYLIYDISLNVEECITQHPLHTSSPPGLVALFLNMLCCCCCWYCHRRHQCLLHQSQSICAVGSSHQTKTQWFHLSHRISRHTHSQDTKSDGKINVKQRHINAHVFVLQRTNSTSIHIVLSVYYSIEIFGFGWFVCSFYECVLCMHASVYEWAIKSINRHWWFAH